jgi:hypothetical protein
VSANLVNMAEIVPPETSQRFPWRPEKSRLAELSWCRWRTNQQLEFQQYWSMPHRNQFRHESCLDLERDQFPQVAPAGDVVRLKVNESCSVMYFQPTACPSPITTAALKLKREFGQLDPLLLEEMKLVKVKACFQFRSPSGLQFLSIATSALCLEGQ